jgi:membrane protease YdiL (CAAX protease family)
VVLSAVVITGTGLCIELARLENLDLDSDVPWFVGVALLISLGTAWSCAQAYQAAEERRTLPARRALIVSVLAGVALAGVAALGMGMLHGVHPTLPGDADPAPRPFRLATAFTDLGTAGLMEEPAIRGLVQLGMQRVMRPACAELLADAEFILLHFLNFAKPGELLLTILTAAVAGRLTARTQATRFAVITHCVCNLSIAIVVLGGRR